MTLHGRPTAENRTCERAPRPAKTEIVHHPEHPWLVERVAASVKASLAYQTEHFGPYPHGQIRFVEHPGAGNSLHAAPVNISFQEGFAHFDPEDDGRDLDFPFAVAAHEVAHQWWGNQLVPAGIDPRHLLIDTDIEDNAVSVEHHRSAMN